MERPRRSIQASAVRRPGVAGAKKLTLISSDMGVISKFVTHMAARAIVASIQPVTNPPCTTPPEWHMRISASISMAARPASASIYSVRTIPRA